MRDDLNPAQAAEAMNPFIYAADTPIARIDEDMTIRLRWSPTRAGMTAQLQGIMAWEAHSRLEQVKGGRRW